MHTVLFIVALTLWLIWSSSLCSAVFSTDKVHLACHVTVCACWRVFVCGHAGVRSHVNIFESLCLSWVLASGEVHVFPNLTHDGAKCDGIVSSKEPPFVIHDYCGSLVSEKEKVQIGL